MPSRREAVCLVVRHGDTDYNDANVFRSRLDPHLNSKGIKQAEDIAAFIHENYSISSITSSPLLRALETAEIIAEPEHLDVVQNCALVSWALGSCLSGRDKEVYADILDYYVDNPSKTPPEGEPLASLRQRTKEFFEPELRNAKGTSVYVTHSSNILTLGLLLDKEAKGRQESEELVGPGGVMAAYKTKDGYELEVVFGKEVNNEFGS